MSDTLNLKPKPFPIPFSVTKFPPPFQETFEKEHNKIWEDLQIGLKEACKPGAPDYDKFMALKPKLEVLLIVYNPSLEQLEILVTVLLRLLLEEKTTNANKLVIMKLIDNLMGDKKFKNLKLNWRAVYNFLDETIYNPEHSIQYASGPADNVFDYMPVFISKLRILYPEEAITEVITLIKQNLKPFFSSLAKGITFLTIFFNTEIKFSKQCYDKWIPQLFEFWSWEDNNDWDKCFVFIFSKLAKNNPEIDWTPYYSQIFTMLFKLVTSTFPMKTISHASSNLELAKKYLLLHPAIDYAECATELLVEMIRPKTFEYTQEYWAHFDRIYRETLPFIHPENPGSWAVSLASWYQHFCKFYVERHLREQRVLKRIQKLQTKKEAGIAQVEQEGENKDEGDTLSIEDDNEQAEQHPILLEEDIDKSRYFLDDSSHERFIKIMSFVIKNLLYSREGAVPDLSAIICRRLIMFRGDIFGPMILSIMHSSFERSDLSHFCFIKVFAFTAYPLLSRDTYKSGLYQLPKILDTTLNQLTSSDLAKTDALLTFYEAVFRIVPITHPDDLRKNYENHFGRKDDKPIKEALNQDEDSDLWELTEDLSDWAVRFFRRLLEIIPSLENSRDGPQTGIQSLLFLAQTLYSFICQSSPRLLDKYVDILCHYLEDNIHKYTNSYITNIIYALSLAAPGLVAKKMIPFLKNKLLCKLSVPKLEEYSKKPLYHLIEQSNVSKIFDNYELSIENKDSLLSGLSLLEDIIAYSSPAILNYTEDLELIIYHALLHDEHIVFSTSAGVLQSLLLSLVSVYPINMGSQNPKDSTREEFLQVYKKIGKQTKKDLEVIWHQPNSKEREYTINLFNLLFKTNLAWLSNKYISGIESKKLDYDTVSSLIDDMHLKGNETPQRERKEIGRSLLLAKKVFYGISQRASYGQIAQLDEFKANFETQFCFAEFSNVREETYQLLNKFILFACSTSCINDAVISQTLIRFLGTVLGYVGQHTWLPSISSEMKLLREFLYANDFKQNFDSRYLLCVDVALELQKKIFGYQTDIDFSTKASDFLLILWSLSFHSNNTVSNLAHAMLTEYTRDLMPSIKDKIMTQLATFNERFIRERFTFLKQNAKELEEKGMVQFHNNQLVKTNKDTYINLVFLGGYSNLGRLFPFLSRHMELVYPLIEILMDNPKPEETGFEIAIFTIFQSIDLTPNEIPLDQSTSTAKKGRKECEKAILESNKSYRRFENEQQELLGNGPKKYHDVSHSFEATQTQMEKCLLGLENEDVHWKHQLINGILGMIIQRYIDPTSALYLRFVQIVLKRSSSDHYYLRFFAFAAFRILTKRLPRKEPRECFVEKKNQDFQNIKFSLDEAIKNRFLLASDYDKHYIKDSYTGFFDTYERLETRQISNELAIEIPQGMKDWVLRKDFFDSLFLTMINDFSTADEGAVASSGGFKDIIHTYFAKADKMTELFPNSAPTSFVYTSFLSALFKYFGGKNNNGFLGFICEGIHVFNISFDSIQLIAQNYNSTPNQIVASRYFYAILKNFIHWKEQDLEDVLSKTSELFINAIDNTSFENYRSWIQTFENAIHRTDLRLLKPFLDKILNSCYEEKGSNIQARYLRVYAVVIKYHGHLADEIALKLQDLLFEFKPTNIHQVFEYSFSMGTLLKYFIMLPINYQKLKSEQIVEDIDAIISKNPDKYHLENEYLLYCINAKFIQTIDNLIEKAKEETCPNQKKNYLQVFFSLMGFFYAEKASSYSLFIHFENLLTFFFELNANEMEPATIKTHTIYLAALSKLAYPKMAIPKILSLIKNCLKNHSSHIRENALKFYEYFHFNHIYYLKDKSIAIKDSLLDENPTVRNLAFDIVIDLCKMRTQDELQKEINDAKQLVSEAKKDPSKTDQISKGLYMIMAILLSCPYEIEEWTEELLVILLQTKKPKIVNEKFTKDFVMRFKSQHEGFANVNQRVLSYEVHSDLREICNPNSYFV